MNRFICFNSVLLTIFSVAFARDVRGVSYFQLVLANVFSLLGKIRQFMDLVKLSKGWGQPMNQYLKSIATGFQILGCLVEEKKIIKKLLASLKTLF